MIKLKCVNHIMVSRNAIQHQTWGSAGAGSARDNVRREREREFLQATLLRLAALQNMQQAGTQKWLRCVPPSLRVW